MSVPEREIEQEVVAPAGAPSPPGDADETARDEAARSEAEAAPADATSEGSAADAQPEGDAVQAASEADAADAQPVADAVQAASEADAADAQPVTVAAQADTAAEPEAEVAPAAPDADGAPAAPEAEGGQEAVDEPAEEAHWDLHERAGKADAYLELAQRTQADFDNYRKRMTREVRAAEARGIGRLARELLPAIDNLERALAAVDSAEPRHHLSEGIRLVTAELSAALGRTGIQGYDPKGERFDPVQHEAVAQQPVAGAEPGTVVEVLQAGYRLNEAILRPARVIVAS
ncbi:MAG: molecular chaperone GrpE [Solirubrobacteraceae bacterium]|nr:molecular chaperone GrpE [Solirubrobacteraceae bacterium]